ncbi:antirestriction protein [filamentous cyanobacterium CCP1]|nr:antirestriction protein [filamentous cyanobacterium CCP1]
MTQPRKDVYALVTHQIIQALEQGVRPWMKPWDSTHLNGRVTMPRRATGESYRGINILLLWGAAITAGYDNPIWMTVKQANKHQANVRKGEKGTMVVYADTFSKTETNDKGEDVAVAIPYLKSYTVFNCAQIEGLPAHFYQAAPPPSLENVVTRDQRLDAYFAATKADLRHGGNRAFYSITHDYVQMPPLEAFHDAESYYATLGHEMVHWTRHEQRLNRDFGRKQWGDEGYAQEELVAEMGAAFLCAALDITPEVRNDHAAYIDSWLKVLRDDKRALFKAASYAQKAVDYLNSLQAHTEPVELSAMVAA